MSNLKILSIYELLQMQEETEDYIQKLDRQVKYYQDRLATQKLRLASIKAQAQVKLKK